MTTVFTIANGEIQQDELVRETTCFYIVNSEYGEQKVSKDGNRLPYSLGAGRSVVTLDREEASEVAAKQLKAVTEKLKREADRIVTAETALRKFNQA